MLFGRCKIKKTANNRVSSLSFTSDTYLGRYLVKMKMKQVETFIRQCASLNKAVNFEGPEKSKPRTQMNDLLTRKRIFLLDEH